MSRISREHIEVTISTERDLASYAVALAGRCSNLTSAERNLAGTSVDSAYVEALRSFIAAGEDPLGELFLALRSPRVRREQGAVYTPAPIVKAMIEWSQGVATPVRVIDPGCGSGRYLVAAARAFPKAHLIACDLDPLATLMTRANAEVLGFADRLDVRVGDFRTLEVSDTDGPTLYIGNPPYVRHHSIAEEAKDWFAKTSARLGFKASKLAGLHIHFFLRTREIAKPGDFGCFVTSAEWMDVNYGSVLRQMLADGLGGSSLQIFSPSDMPFADAMTTGAITCFKVGQRPKEFTVRELSSIDDLDDLNFGRSVPWCEVEAVSRWTQLLRPREATQKGMIPLGDLFRVSRGSVTGNNEVFLAGAYAGALPKRYLVPAVTRARDLIEARPALKNGVGLRQVIALPSDLTELKNIERAQVNRFLKWAEKLGASKSYTAQSRNAWWAVPMKDPAPILCTYMGRRPPVFVRNLAEASFINIAHGLYPKVTMTARELDAYASYLNQAVCVSDGRTYAGGLTKFEPKEIERLLVPELNQIQDTVRTLRRPKLSGVSHRARSLPSE